ncbi:MAG: hypothetical protein SGPRY_008572 [Prymnesium sp.]
MPRSILKASSTGRKKQVRLDLTPKEKEISPTNRLMKGELFYNTSDFRAFQVDARQSEMMEWQKNEQEEAKPEMEKVRNMQSLWADQQIRNYEPLQVVLKRASAVLTAAPPQKKLRGSAQVLPCALEPMAKSFKPPAPSLTDTSQDSMRGRPTGNTASAAVATPSYDSSSTGPARLAEIRASFRADLNYKPRFTCLQPTASADLWRFSFLC